MIRSKREPEEEGEGWLTTFGDMVTLLFTFFVLVYSFCSFDPGKWESASHAIKGALAAIPGRKGDRLVPGGGTGLFPGHLGIVRVFANAGELKELGKGEGEKGLEKLAHEVSQSEGIDVEETESGLIFRIENPILFDLGKADLKPSSRPILEKIATIAKARKATVIVSGHTCDLPISTEEFQSNWELSARRATNVVRELERVGGRELKFAVIARAEYEPLVPNIDDQSRSKNRRVEIRLDFGGVLSLGI